VTGADPDLAGVVALERALLDPATRRRPGAVQKLLHPGFREFGASGAIWDRDAMVAALAADPGGPVEMAGVAARAVADGAVLVTYTATAAAGRSLRSSLWVRDEDGWRVLFHQGTPAA
jgi:ribonuclease HI